MIDLSMKTGEKPGTREAHCKMLVTVFIGLNDTAFIKFFLI